MTFTFPAWYVALADRVLPRWIFFAGTLSMAWWIATGDVRNPAFWLTMVFGGVFCVLWGLVFVVVIFYPAR